MRAQKQTQRRYYKYSDTPVAINPDGLITTNTGGNGWVIYTYGGNYGELYLMLNPRANTSYPRWQTGSPNVYACFKTPKKCILTSYTTYQRCDGKNTGRICNHWKIVGYNSFNDMVNLYNGTVIDDNTWPSKAKDSSKTVDLSSNTNGFQYYSIHMISNFAGSSYCSMGNTLFYARELEQGTENNYDYYEDVDCIGVLNKQVNNQGIYYTPRDPNVDKIRPHTLQGLKPVGNVRMISGVATNFSLNNYLKVDKPFTPGTSQWEKQLVFKVDYPGSSIDFAIDNGLKSDWVFPKLTVRTTSDTTLQFQPCLSSNGTNWDIHSTRYSVNFDYSKKAYIKLKFTGTQYILSFKQEGDADFTVLATITNSNIIYQPADNLGFSLGADISSGSQWESYFRGVIYYDECYFKIGDKYTYCGEMPFGTRSFGITDYAIEKGPVNYAYVGTPSVVNGLLSGCTSTNYVTTDTIFETKDYDWEIITKIKFDSFPAVQTILSFVNGNTRSVQLSMKDDGHVRWYLSSDGTSNNIASGTTSSIVYATDTWYYFKLTYSSTQGYYAYSSTDKVNWTQCLYNESTTPIFQKSKLSFGYNFSSYPEPLTNGALDLNETTIKIDNWYWFGGANLIWANPNIYLQSDGLGQYIQTNIQATGDTEISTSFSVAQTETLSSIFSSRTSYNTANFGLSSREQGVLTAYYNKSNIDIPNFIVQPNRRTYIDMIKNNISVDNTSYGSIDNYSSFTASIPLRFFALATSTPSYFLNGKLYRTNIVNGNDKYDFVPVPEGLQIGNYKVPSNGMFDIVTQTFFPNAGTGEFNYGKDTE